MWRDLTDPRKIAKGVDPEANRDEPVFANVHPPERFDAATVLVDDYKVRRYAFTVGDYHPWAFGDSPFGGRIAQAGLLTNDLVQLFTMRYAASRVVGLHTEEQLWFERPIHVGAQVTLAGGYVQKYEKRGLGYVVMEAEATGRDGERFIRHRGIEVLRTVPGQVAGRGSATAREGSDKAVTGDYDPDLPYVVKAGSGLRSGMPLAPLNRVITAEQAAVFSRLGEYVVNIHNNIDRAREAGLNIPIIQGQQQACVLLELLTRLFGKAWFLHGWFKCKFIRPVQVFERLLVGCVVTNVETEGDKSLITLDIWTKQSNGSLATVGWASCLVDGMVPAQVTPVPSSTTCVQ